MSYPGIQTIRLDTQAAVVLRGSHRVERYVDAGWACAAGFNEMGEMTIAVHAGAMCSLDEALQLQLQEGSISHPATPS